MNTVSYTHLLLHVTPIPYLKASGEMKTKPTQASVKELQGMGIQPDVLICRSEYPLTEEIRQKIAPVSYTHRDVYKRQPHIPSH